MANELKLTASIIFRKGATVEGVDLGELSVTVAGSKCIHARQTISNAADEAIVLGEVGSGGWLLIVNRDATNYVVIKGAAAAVAMPRLLPGEFSFFRLDDNAAAPVALADAAPVEIEYLLVAK